MGASMVDQVLPGEHPAVAPKPAQPPKSAAGKRARFTES